jgi:acetyl-CoA C-acetyltransferase
VGRSVIVGGARTPFGKLGGALGSVGAVELGTTAAKGAIERSGVDAAELDYCVFGCVIQAGLGHIPSRQVSLAAGMRVEAGSETVNKVCASGLRAIAVADNMIRLGDAERVLAGGMESMTGGPHLLLGGRRGLPYGDATMRDATVWDGLRDPWSGRQMYEQAATVAGELSQTREELDAWSLRSQERALAAIDSGAMAEEIVPVTVGSRRGETVVDTDEAPRRGTTAEGLAALRPLQEGGLITAGNAPGVNDGAAAVVVMEEGAANERGLEPLARILASGYAADRYDRLALAPAVAAQHALARAGLGISDVALWEINEAFASVAVNASRDLGIDAGIVNQQGGAIALGHPLGASGARLVVTLIHQLRRRGGGIGVVAICSGGGQGDALVLEVA